nr:YabP/YqfC family sporulation protein [uncultured Sellimonas sp.]
MGKRKNRKDYQNTPRGDALRQKIAETVNAPKDVVLGIPLLHMTGQTELCIENYRGILEYTDELIRVKTKSGILKITGRCLQIEYYLNDDMKVRGQIWKIEFEKGEKHC